MSHQAAGCSSAEPEIEAVLFDLDDTIYPQADWLAGAWDAVARRAAAFGVDGRRLDSTLTLIAAAGSDRGRIIDRALAQLGATGVPVAPLVEAFHRAHAQRLWPYAGAAEVLHLLATRVPIGLVTDGEPDVQRAKLRSLCLERSFDALVFSDDLGRDKRKPHPAALVRAARMIDVDPARCVYIGDRPEKDVAAARAARMRAVRVRTGEYSYLPDAPRPWFAARDLTQAARRIWPLLGARRSPSAA
jgi:putative hydrolase of the HAD superfamily